MPLFVVERGKWKWFVEVCFVDGDDVDDNVAVFNVYINPRDMAAA